MGRRSARAVSVFSSIAERRRAPRGWPVAAVVAAALLAAAAGARTPDLAGLRTRAEASNWEQTSRHADVVTFLETLGAGAPDLHVERLGYSAEGRVLPLVVWGCADPSAAAVRASGKLRVYLQGGIHGGEVCGKEALLLLARQLAAGERDEWSASMVLLIAPLYNADGNERIDSRGRARQNGPFAGVGQRATARGFDLNRDHVKLDTPEAYALARLLRDYDPHVYVDLHTTDGTYHAYHLTYAPPLHPATYAPLVALLRDALLPAVTRRVEERHGWRSFYYGNLPPPDHGNLSWEAPSTEPGWYSYDHRPRYSSNYAGARNRIGLLGEAYSYAPFEERVRVSLAFCEEVLEYLHGHGAAVTALLRQADEHTVVGESLAVRARLARAAAPVTILKGAVAEEANPFTGDAVLRRLDVAEPVAVADYGAFEATQVEVAPRAYLVPAGMASALRLLELHGIGFRRLAADTIVTAEAFRIDSTRVAAELYEGHRELTLYGRYEPLRTGVAAGTALVPLAQPLGRLAFLLLEPRADDGVVAWNLVDADPDSLDVYPILRLPAPP